MEQQLSWGRVPIVACTAELTGANSHKLRSVCLCSGMDDCFVSPPRQSSVVKKLVECFSEPVILFTMPSRIEQVQINI